jgi:hypothetical protein
MPSLRQVPAQTEEMLNSSMESDESLSLEY